MLLRWHFLAASGFGKYDLIYRNKLNIMNNDIGLFDTITADYIVNGAKMELDLVSTTTQDVYLLNKVNEGLGALRNFYTQVPQIAVLDINPVTLSAQVPNGFIRLMGNNSVRLLDDSVNILIGDKKQQGNLPVPPTSDGFFKGNLAYYAGAKVVDGYIYFNNDITQTQCEISYLGTNIDEKGDLKIPAIAYRVLLSFVCSEWLYKNNDKRYAKWDERWRSGKAWLRGIYNTPDELETKLMGYTNNHMASYKTNLFWFY